jgi:hypothetical protein
MSARVNGDIDAGGAAPAAAAGSGLPVLPPTTALPGRGRLAVWLGGSIAFCIICLPAALASHVPDAGVLLATPILVLLLGFPLRRARLRQLVADARFLTLAGDPAARALSTALAPAGLREVVLRTGPARGLARNFRAGPRAVLLVHQDLLSRPDPAAFFLAHEAAHLARHDGARRPVVVTSVLAAWFCLVLAWHPAVVALPLLIVGAAAFNHAMELDCDRIAASWIGSAPAEHALEILETARQRMQLTTLQLIRRKLTYPLPDRRLHAVLSAAAPVPAGTAPPDTATPGPVPPGTA